MDDDFEHTEPSSAQYVQQILEGLQFMHSQAIVHLDLKPENIVCVSPSSHWIKIIDFGLARKLGEQEAALVCPGQGLSLVTASGTGSGPWGTKPGPLLTTLRCSGESCVPPVLLLRHLWVFGTQRCSRDLQSALEGGSSTWDVLVCPLSQTPVPGHSQLAIFPREIPTGLLHPLCSSRHPCEGVARHP